MLERGDVDPILPDINGLTPVENATINGHERVVKLLQEWENHDPNRLNESSRAPPTNATIRGQEGAPRSSREQDNFDPNPPDEDHLSTPTNAAIKGQEGVVMVSLEQENADPNRPDSDDLKSVETPDVPARREWMRDRLKQGMFFWKKKLT